jgi:hypothetical protein
MHSKFDRKTWRERPLRRIRLNDRLILKRKKKMNFEEVGYEDVGCD